MEEKKNEVTENVTENKIIKNQNREKNQKGLSNFFNPKNKKAQIILFSALGIFLVFLIAIITISILGII
ncbi:hypothetical protein [Mycoplasma sp. VS42A]|uniref:hypothetical protein n=1 Tax=unclassified Mycoplasma TaxID=2683645 RepID=UPI003A885062